MAIETTVLAQATFINKCLSSDCAGVWVCFLPEPLGFTISVFYLLVRKNLFTFRIPVSSERWPVLMYPLSSPNCPLALSPPPSSLPPTTNQCYFLHFLNQRNSLTYFHLLNGRPAVNLAVSAVNKILWCVDDSWGCGSAMFLATTPSRNNRNRAMLSVLALDKSNANVSSQFWVLLLGSPGWRIPPRPRHQMEALLALWAGRVISCQEAWC